LASPLSDQDITPPLRQLPALEMAPVPALFLDASEQAWRRVLDFFTAHLRNPNTRAAYGQAVGRFARWCSTHGVTLQQVSPYLVAAYVEELLGLLAVPSFKQHLAASRTLFDHLVTGQVLPTNPAASVRGPKHVLRKGLTPVLSPDEARTLLEAIEATTPGGLRDRALIGTMVYRFARVGAVVAMNAEDYFPQGRRLRFRLHEKEGASCTTCRRTTRPRSTSTPTWQRAGPTRPRARRCSAPWTALAA
jgi:integrase/recombinase XerD